MTVVIPASELARRPEQRDRQRADSDIPFRGTPYDWPAHLHPRGFKMKDGKLVKNLKHLDVSAQLRAKASKRVRPARRAIRT